MLIDLVYNKSDNLSHEKLIGTRLPFLKLFCLIFIFIIRVRNTSIYPVIIIFYYMFDSYVNIHKIILIYRA